MCNLNLLIKTGELRNTANFLNCVSSVSYSENPHAEGVWSDKTGIHKSLNKIDFMEFENEFDLSKYILIHERYSTGGDGVQNAHPFENEEFVLLHNGVMHSFSNYGGEWSDTALFFQKFIEVFNTMDGDREEKIKQTIKKLLDDNNESWSIALQDKTTDTLYYFKNASTRINAFKNHKYLYITTNEFNENFLNMLNCEYKPIKLNPYIIHKISVKDDKIEVRHIGKIKQKIIQYIKPVKQLAHYSYKTNDFSNYNNDYQDMYTYNQRYSGINNYNDMDDEINTELGLMTLDRIKSKCVICGKMTNQQSYVTNDFVCDDCKEAYYNAKCISEFT